MILRHSPNPDGYATLSPDALRSAFLIESLFAPGRIELVHTDADRAIVGSAVPGGAPLRFENDPELRSEYFCERRELGVLNIGGPGAVEVDGKRMGLAGLECLYIGRGSREISFSSDTAETPAAFYLLSYPAHAAFPTRRAQLKDANVIQLGTMADANRRAIHQYIHPGGIQSCQLVMGFTRLQEGSVWNTMPPHTHTRRSEIYLYFDVGADRRVMHFMGTPQQTRHLVVSDRQAVISPNWSIHCGCGTGAYAFCWGMGGENQAFDDMDAVGVGQLR